MSTEKHSPTCALLVRNAACNCRGEVSVAPASDPVELIRARLGSGTAAPDHVLNDALALLGEVDALRDRLHGAAIRPVPTDRR